MIANTATFSACINDLLKGDARQPNAAGEIASSANSSLLVHHAETGLSHRHVTLNALLTKGLKAYQHARTSWQSCELIGDPSRIVSVSRLRAFLRCLGYIGSTHQASTSRYGYHLPINFLLRTTQGAALQP